MALELCACHVGILGSSKNHEAITLRDVCIVFALVGRHFSHGAEWHAKIAHY